VFKLRKLALASLTLAHHLGGCAEIPASPAGSQERFFSAWTVSQNIAEKAPALSNHTVRMIVRPSIDGASLRIKLENTVAPAPVVFSAAYIGVLDKGAAIIPGTNKALKFNGQTALTLAAGASVYSDPLEFPVKAFQRLAVSLDVTEASAVATHSLGLATNYYAPGMHAGEASGEGFSPVPPNAQGIKAFPFYWITAVDVKSSTNKGTIVAIGDSITDGRCSTATDNGRGEVLPDLYQRWTDILARRLAALPSSYPKAVANEGIAGNRILAAGVTGPSALERLERDVLDRAGLTHVIFFEGTNDIFRGATPTQVIDGSRQIIERVHAKGAKIIGVTAIPRGRPEGASGTGLSTIQEQYRHEFNDWIRTRAGFDGVIDFDAVMAGGGKSPTGAEITRPAYTCDFVHPNAAGYKALGESIDLQLFQ
jgi:lysophospholipase L1-like esterase